MWPLVLWDAATLSRVGFPIDVALSRTAFRVGDSVEVTATVFGAYHQVVREPTVRLTVSDSAVAELRGVWLIGRRPGQAEVRAEGGDQVGSALVTVQ